MNNETNQTQTPTSEITIATAEDYIQAIAELHSNTVPKEEYQKVVDERRQLIQSLTRGETLMTQPTKEKRNIDELRNRLGEPDLTNMEYWTRALELREAVMEEGKPDPFTPIGHQVQATEEDKAMAQRVADGITWCIEKADGNPAVFNSYLQQITVEPPEVRLMRAKKK